MKTRILRFLTSPRTGCTLAGAFAAVALLTLMAATGPEPTGGYTLRSGTQTVTDTVKNSWLSNLGLPFTSASGVVTSSTATTTFAGQVKLTGTFGLLTTSTNVNLGATAGSIVWVSGTGLKVYLTPTTGIVIKDGTNTTF